MKSLYEFVRKAIEGEIAQFEATLSQRRKDLKWLNAHAESSVLPVEIQIKSLFEKESGVHLIESGVPKELFSDAMQKFRSLNDHGAVEVKVHVLLPNNTRIPLPEEFYK